MEIKKHLKWIALIVPILFGVLLALPGKSEAAATKFRDFGPGDEGYEEVMKLVNKGVLRGYPDGDFKPYHSILREHSASMLTKALELPIPSDIEGVLSRYKDVRKGFVYDKEIAAVTAAGIFKGDNGYFQPYLGLDRDQMASILVRAYDLKDLGTPVELSDIDKINPSHRENVNILAQHGITIGKIGPNGERYFDGTAPVTRVQFAIFLSRAMEVN